MKIPIKIPNTKYLSAVKIEQLTGTLAAWIVFRAAGIVCKIVCGWVPESISIKKSVAGETFCVES